MLILDVADFRGEHTAPLLEKMREMVPEMHSQALVIVPSGTPDSSAKAMQDWATFTYIFNQLLENFDGVLFWLRGTAGVSRRRCPAAPSPLQTIHVVSAASMRAAPGQAAS